jgi:predicted nucleotidyltransferase
MNQTAELSQSIASTLNSNGLIISTIHAALPDTLAIYVFGSRVNTTANVESDLDLAVLTTTYADPVKLWELSGDLAEIAGCPVDLLDMRAASTVMQYQILQTGYRLWGEDLSAGLFECYVLSEKNALDNARAGLLADIQGRGRVYG